MHLQALTVRNFQRHKSLSVTFSPRITSIQGPTDSGKSSLLRALRWLCLNDFSGNDFIREGSNKTQVTLNFRHRKADYELARTRGDRLNVYSLNGAEYKSFATNVPEDVAGCLRLSEINFQGQHDAPFWFNETAGEVSRRLNAVVDLSVIDTVLSEAAAIVREAESTVKVSEQRLAELTEAQEKLDPQLGRIADFETLKQRNEIYTEQIEASDCLASVLADCGAYQAQLARLRPQIKTAGALRKSLAAYFQQERQLSSLRLLCGELTQLKQIRRPPNFQPLNQAYAQQKETSRTVDRLVGLLSSIEATDRKADAALRASSIATTAFHLATKNERCPLCQNPL